MARSAGRAPGAASVRRERRRRSCTIAASWCRKNQAMLAGLTGEKLPIPPGHEDGARCDPCRLYRIAKN